MSNKQLEFDFDKAGVEILPYDKPTVYIIYDANGNIIYIGVSKAGRIVKRLKEHLLDPEGRTKGGVKVKIEQCASDYDAKELEAGLIEEHNPPGNVQGV